MLRVRDALAHLGFDVFSDQQTPAGIDWDTWIRGELAKSKCAVVLWSVASAASDNVRHEATVAKRQGKLISVFIESLVEVDIPLGLYAQQAANLASWNGDYTDDEWRKLQVAIEGKLTPGWVQDRIASLDAELEGERARRRLAETHEKTLRTQVSKEVQVQEDLRRERDSALSELGGLKAAVEDRGTALQAQSAKQAETEQSLKTERDSALTEVERLRSAVEQLTKVHPGSESEPIKRWLTPTVIGAVLLAIVVSGVLAVSSSSNHPNREAEVQPESAALAKSEQARQAAEAQAAEADKARRTAEAKAASVTSDLAKSEQARQAAQAKADALAASPNAARGQAARISPTSSPGNRSGISATGVDWSKGCLTC